MTPDQDAIVTLPTFESLVWQELHRAIALYPPHDTAQKTFNSITKELTVFRTTAVREAHADSNRRALLALVKIAALCWRVAGDSGVLLEHGIALDRERYAGSTEN